MKLNPPHKRRGTSSWFRHLILAMTLVGAGSLLAQPMPADHAAHAGHAATTTAPADASLPQQVEALKAKVAQLDEALRRAGATTAPTAAAGGMAGMPAAAPMPAATPPAAGAMSGMAPMPSGGAMPATAGGMAGMGGNGGMGDMMQMMGGMMQQMGGMMKMDGMAPKPAGGMGVGMPGGMGGEMAGMGMGMSGTSGGAMPGAAPPAGMQGMAMPPKPPMQNMPPTMGSGMMEMKGMMGMPPVAAMASSAALPGFPGASHLYHIGADEFFLNHDQHITLTTPQRTALTMAKEKSALDKASAERGIAQAEQDLWQLTSADQPDAAKVEAKIQEIGKLRGDERMNFIRAVGEAAKLLSSDQIKQLLGQLPPAMPQPAAPMAPGMSGGMGHM